MAQRNNRDQLGEEQGKIKEAKIKIKEMIRQLQAVEDFEMASPDTILRWRLILQILNHDDMSYIGGFFDGKQFESIY